MRHTVFRSTLSHFGGWNSNALSDTAGTPYTSPAYLTQEKEDAQKCF